MYILNDLPELTIERVEVTENPAQNGLHGNVPWEFAASAPLILSERIFAPLSSARPRVFGSLSDRFFPHGHRKAASGSWAIWSKPTS